MKGVLPYVLEDKPMSMLLKALIAKGFSFVQQALLRGSSIDNFHESTMDTIDQSHQNSFIITSERIVPRRCHQLTPVRQTDLTFTHNVSK
jgi:hypothetical protein